MKRILVCTDGSNYGNVCCQFGAWIAGRAAAEVEVLYVSDLRQFEVPLVADLGGSLGVQPYQAVLGQLQELENRKAEVVLNAARRVFEENGYTGKVATSHRTGMLVECLHDAQDSDALLVLGKRGENANFATEHLGSTMERVVRAINRPYLITSRAFKPITRAVVAFDGSASSRRALEYLVGESAFKGLEVHVVTVAGGMDADEALRHLNEAEQVLRKAGFVPVCQMLHGTPEDQIAGYVISNNINLLVMGAYGHSRIRYLILGSTTTTMVRICKVPVLLCR